MGVNEKNIRIGQTLAEAGDKASRELQGEAMDARENWEKILSGGLAPEVALARANQVLTGILDVAINGAEEKPLQMHQWMSAIDMSLIDVIDVGTESGFERFIADGEQEKLSHPTEVIAFKFRARLMEALFQELDLPEA